MLWRETLPEHYKTTNGEWDRSLHSSCPKSISHYQTRPLGCRALKIRSGNLQLSNDIAVPIIIGSGIPIIRTFGASVPFWELHKGCSLDEAQPDPDCTSWPFPSPVLRHVNLVVLSAIGRKLGLRKTQISSQRAYSDVVTTRIEKN